MIRRGTRHSWYDLSEDDVKLIRQLTALREYHRAESAKLSFRRIAEKFDTTQYIVRNIAHLRGYMAKHSKTPEKIVTTRKEARELGIRRYYTGNPCPKGHKGARFTLSANCERCTLEANRRKRAARRL